MSRLFIAEKPSMGREIGKVLGANIHEKEYWRNDRGDVVTWCFGHILELFSPDEYDESLKEWKRETLPIFPDQWKLKIKKDCKAQFNVIKKLVSDATSIVNAGDPDREGQLLIDEVLDYIGNKKPVKRILLNALDEKSIKTALNNLRDNKEFYGLYESARARSQADWLVGMNLSRAYTIMARRGGYNSTISVGRVQTPTLALVVRREQEIKNFVPKDFYLLKVIWHHLQGDIVSTWEPGDNVELDSEGRILNKAAAEAVFARIQNSIATILEVERTKKKESPRLPYSLSSLQIEAGSKYGYSPEKVLNTMQSLYEKKYTSYPRSDCDYLPENQLADAGKIISNLRGIFTDGLFASGLAKADTGRKSRAWNDKKISAHHAIIPTIIKCSLDELSTEERNLYEMVAKAYCAQFLPDHEYMATKIILVADNEKFKATGKEIIVNGWKDLFDNKQEDDSLPALPKVNKDEKVHFKSGAVESRKTTPPKRYTEATLLRAMKEIHKYVRNPDLKGKLKSVSGLGTEATRASIISELQKRSFLKKEKKAIVPTDIANTIIGILPEIITYPDTTAIWEDLLGRIADNELPVAKFMEAQKKMISNLVDKADTINTSNLGLREPLGKCPRCGKNIYENANTFSCEGYSAEPQCKFTIWKMQKYGILKNRKVTASNVKAWLSGKTVKFDKLKGNSGKEFTALIGIEDKGDCVNFTLHFEKNKPGKKRSWEEEKKAFMNLGRKK